MARDGHRDGNGYGDRDRHSSQRDYGHGRNDRDGRHDRYDRYDRDDRRHGHRDDRRHSSWSRGGYYRHGGGFVVNDYHRYHLRHPGRGHHWVRHGSDYLLVALATGLIADVIIDNHGY